MAALRLRLFTILKSRHFAVCQTCTAKYRTKGGHYVSPGIQRDEQLPRSREDRVRYVQEAEQLEDEFTIDNPNFFSDTLGKEIKKQKQAKFKIIEKKYFKPTQEVNLLTWDAKEQIRFLNQEYPDEWSVDRLAESFPTSRKGVINILKSKWMPRSLSEVLRHDRRVRQHWVALKAGGQENGGPIEMRYQKLIESGKLTNAAGNESLPAPQKKRFLLDARDNPTLLLASKTAPSKRISTKGSSIGPFESLVKDYCERKKVRESVEVDKDVDIKRYSEHRNETKHLLQTVVLETGSPQTSPILGVKPEQDLLHSYTGKDVTIDGRKPGHPEADDRSVFDQMQRESQTLFMKQAEAILSGAQEIPEGTIEAHMNNPSAPESGRKSLRGRSATQVRHPSLTESEMNKLKMDTKKIGWVGDADGEFSIDQTQNSKYRVDNDQAHVLDQVRYDVPHGADPAGPEDEEEEEAFLYTEDTGYQYPFGRSDPSLQLEVDKPPRSEQRTKLYQKGRTFYDEDGELLYRIP